MKKKRRCLGLLLAFVLLFSNITVMAADATPTDPVTEEATEATTEVQAEECEEGLTQILVGTEDEGIFRKGDRILSSYNGIYLLDFATSSEAEEAVTYYKGVADFAELNEVIRVAEGEGAEEVAAELESDEDAITVLNEIVGDGEACTNKTIALIDTGVAGGGVSVLGDDGIDENGHGSLMLETILSENASANVLSVKAFGGSGYAQVSDVYAAIQYAIEKNVGIINFSASKMASEDSEVIRNVITEATAKGIIFVGSAGNNNADVKYFIPGNISEATIIGSAKEDGTKTKTSNYGDTVDYYVVADSTSVATAKFTGMLSKGSIEEAGARDDVFTKLKENASTDGTTEKETDLFVTGLPDYFSVDLTNGGSASIHSGGTIRYGSWGTTPFSTETSSPTATNFNGTCIQPSLETPAGTYPVSQVTNQRVIDAMYIMYAMYNEPSDPWPAAQGDQMVEVYDQWMGSTSYSYEEKLYVMWHLVMSYAVAQNLSDYANNDWYQSCPSGVQSCVAAVYNNIFSIYYQFGNHAPDRFKVYILKAGSGKQDIVLWEMEPEARVRIAKSVRFAGTVLTPAQYEAAVADFKKSGESAYNLMRNTEYGVSYSNTDFSKTSSNYAGTLVIEGDADSEGDADNVSGSVNVTPNKNFYIKELKASDSGFLDINTTVYGPFQVAPGKRLNIGVSSVDLSGTNESFNNTVLYDDDKTLPMTIIKSSENPAITNGNSYYNPAGITFTLYREDNLTSTATTNKVGTFTITDRNWTVKAVSTNAQYAAEGGYMHLHAGYYYLKETSGSTDGSYLLKSENQEHFKVTAEEIGGGNVKSFSFTNPPRTVTIRIKKTSTNPRISNNNRCYSLKDAKFGVYKTRADALADRGRVATITTNASGVGDVQNLPHGQYWIKEVQAPKGFILNNTVYPADVSSSVSQTIETPEVPGDDPATMIVKKKNADRALYLGDAVFCVKYYDVDMTTDPALSGETPKATWYFKTDQYGVARIGETWLDQSKTNSELYYSEQGDPSLPYGTITVQEVTAPKGYVVDPTVSVYPINETTTAQPQTVRENAAVKSNTPKKQSFQLVKLGEAKDKQVRTLEGAGFSACSIYNESGLPTLDPVPDGYKVKAGDVIVKASDGTKYFWDDSKCVEITADGKKEMFTDKDGKALSKELDYGKYIVRETTVPDEFFEIEPFTVVIDQDSREPQALRYYIDESFKAYIKIVKIDKDKQVRIMNNAATFKIWSVKDKAYVSMKIYEDGKYRTVSEFKTGKDGEIVTPEALFPGEYRVEEYSSPSGYYKDHPDAVYPVSISKNTVFEQYVDADGVTTNMGVYTITVDNPAIYCTLKINKTGEKRVYNWDTSMFETSVIPLDGIVFDVIADEDIFAPYNKKEKLYSKGDIVETLTTDKDGHAKVEGLYPAKYLVHEHTPKIFKEADDIPVVFLEADAMEKKTGNTVEKMIEKELDIKNEAKVPELGTSAKDKKSNSHSAKAEGTLTIVDTVTYKNLIVGETYTLVARPVIFGTDTHIKDKDGIDLEVTVTFVPETENGEQQVAITFDSKEVKDGKTVTVLEYLYYGEDLVAKHDNSKDEEQSVRYDKPDTPDTPKTGDATKPILLFTLMGLAVAGIITLIIMSRRKRKIKED